MLIWLETGTCQVVERANEKDTCGNISPEIKYLCIILCDLGDL